MVSFVLAESMRQCVVSSIAIWRQRLEPSLLLAELTCFRCCWHREQLKVEFMVRDRLHLLKFRYV